jgi:hypothetical protein
MEIANPIYDAVFKFLMEDKAAASLIIGAITGFDIEDIELRPTEVATDANGTRQWTVYRLDLSAKIRTPEGLKLVLIEVQKAKFHTDIMRFRRYLGSQYVSETNYETVPIQSGGTRQRALPIFTIYILGKGLEHNTDIPVIRVNRTYLDNSTGQTLQERDEFIESLTHDCAVIQVPALKERRRNRLERILAVFDQALIKPEDHHLLSFDDSGYPQECQVVIRRLLRAMAENDVRQRMIVEDEIVSEFEMRDRREVNLRQEAQEAKAREQNEKRQKEEALRKQEDERRQKEEAQRKQEDEQRQKEEALRKQEDLAATALKALIAAGVPEAEARRELGL